MSFKRVLGRKDFRNFYMEDDFPLKMAHQVTAQEGRPSTGTTVVLDKETKAN